jgi:hypothetical protein
MHDNAKGAMVGIGVERVDVGHLGHGQQCQQNETHEGCHPKSAGLWMVTAASMWSESCQ